MHEEEKAENLYDKIDGISDRTLKIEQEISEIKIGLGKREENSLHDNYQYSNIYAQSSIYNFIVGAEKKHGWFGSKKAFFNMKLAISILLMVLFVMAICIAVIEKTIIKNDWYFVSVGIIFILIGIVIVAIKLLRVGYTCDSFVLEKKSVYEYEITKEGVLLKGKRKFFSKLSYFILYLLIFVDIVCLTDAKPAPNHNFLWIMAIILLCLFFIILVTTRILLLIFYSKYDYILIKGYNYNNGEAVTIVYCQPLKRLYTEEDFYLYFGKKLSPR